MLKALAPGACKRRTAVSFFLLPSYLGTTVWDLKKTLEAEGIAVQVMSDYEQQRIYPGWA